jgi:FimV-like protein
LGQETGAASDRTAPDSRAKSGVRPAASFRVKGVLISRLTRTALVNGQLVQEGDRVGGVEVLAIEQAGVRVLAGTREFTVDVGGTFIWDQSSSDVAGNSRKRASQSRHQEKGMAARSASFQDSGTARFNAQSRHAVQSGETLSGIALRYLTDGVTMNQMMIALFQANKQAFDDNINVLYEGATLRIPEPFELHQHAPGTATAEVARHRDMWLPAAPQKMKIADSSDNKRYGPVESGETLSVIAVSLLHDGTTMEQMMIALFQANPHAFSNNINVVHQGAILRIPDENELRRQTPEMAATEVIRHLNAWQTGGEKHALASLAHSNMMASSNELMER